MLELNSDIKMNTNSLYSSIKQNRDQEDQYTYVSHDEIIYRQDYPQDTIQVDSNPLYGRVQGSHAYDVSEPEYDAVIQPNPLYSSVSKETTQTSKDEDEDEDSYVETNSQRASYLKIIACSTKEEESVYDNDTDDTVNVEVNPNPSYDAGQGVKLEDNPSYTILSSY